MRLGVEAALVDGELFLGDVEVDDGRVAAIGLAGPGSGIAAPGFVDLQVNGFGGVDFLDAGREDYARAGEALLGTGVTAYLPTFITSPEEQIVEALTVVASLDVPGPRVLGAHLEGPFLSPARPGIHRAEWFRDPDLGLLDRLLAAGPVRLVTLAPELPEADVLIDRLIGAGVHVSLGHTDATADEARAAFGRGARTITHLFNAMRPLRHRDPGVVGAALATSRISLQVIADRVHVADDVLRIVLGCAAERIVLVTDAMAGAGQGDGVYRLGDVEVTVTDGIARRADGTLAGSLLTMIDAVRNLHLLGAPLEVALSAASLHPADAIDARDLGRLAIGGRADIVVLDDRLELRRVLVGGVERVAG